MGGVAPEEEGARPGSAKPAEDGKALEEGKAAKADPLAPRVLEPGKIKPILSVRELWSVLRRSPYAREVAFFLVFTAIFSFGASAAPAAPASPGVPPRGGRPPNARCGQSASGVTRREREPFTILSNPFWYDAVAGCVSSPPPSPNTPTCKTKQWRSPASRGPSSTS